MEFSETLLDAIGAWQNGWQEQQDRRLELANALETACGTLRSEFRTVSADCYRKRFLRKGELADVFLKDHLDEGVVSWTTDLRFAERFKGLHRTDAVSGAVFRHRPTDDEVVVNIEALWQDQDFVKVSQQYQKDGGKFSEALFNFGAKQGEVVLRSPLKGSQIIGLTGASSPFDDLCDHEGIPDADRDEIFKKLVDQGIYPGEYRFVSEQGTRNVINRTISQMIEKIQAARQKQGE